MTAKITVILLAFFVGGCAGTGFEKRTTLVPDSISVGYAQQRFQSDPEAWKGFTASATWILKGNK